MAAFAAELSEPEQFYARPDPRYTPPPRPAVGRVLYQKKTLAGGLQTDGGWCKLSVVRKVKMEIGIHFAVLRWLRTRREIFAHTIALEPEAQHLWIQIPRLQHLGLRHLRRYLWLRLRRLGLCHLQLRLHGGLSRSPHLKI
jgi:hypothetical protein